MIAESSPIHLSVQADPKSRMLKVSKTTIPLVKRAALDSAYAVGRI